MFDLEKAIADWRDSLCRNDAMTVESATELEEHLRETIASLHSTTVNEPTINEHEAFVIATMRLGSPNELVQEYEKVNAGAISRKRLAWMIGGYVGGGVIGCLINGAGSLSSAAISLAGFSGVASGISAVSLMAICWIGLFIYLVFSKHQWNRLRHPVGLALVLVVAIFFGLTMDWGGNLMHERQMGMSQFGESMIWRAYGTLLVQIGVFTTCLCLIIRHGRSRELN